MYSKNDSRIGGGLYFQILRIEWISQGNKAEIVHDRFPIEIIEPLTEKEYFVRGCTALLDAVGVAIEKIDNVQKRLPESHKAGKVIFVITTDGLENSSEQFTYAQIRRLIREKKECGWEFLFLGANIDAEKEAEKIGISRNRSVTFENDPEGIAINFETVGRTISEAVEADCLSAVLERDWSEDIVRYREESRRKKRG